MDVSQLCRTLRLVLESAPDAPTLEDLLKQVDGFVQSVQEVPDRAAIVAALEDELQAIYDYASLTQTEPFLGVLYHLRPVLPPSSLISTWFEPTLRPALREPRLPTPSVEYAKGLIIAALDLDSYVNESEEEREKQQDKVSGFRRRLMDLYLLDALNESSGDDVLEWASLDTEQREKKSCWKTNLEDVLIRVGLERPEDFLTEVFHCFTSPSSRLQLLILLNVYTSQPQFLDVASVLASHRLTTTILHSLLFDNSSTVAVVALTVLTKLLPIFAVKATDKLKRYVPLLVLVLARVVCWRERQDPAQSEPPLDSEGTSESGNVSDVEEGLPDAAYTLPISEDINWERLEQTFLGGASSAPSAHRYFTMLYYLYPCNTLRFLRYPKQYMADFGCENPYAVDWEEVLDEPQIRSKSEPLMRGHVLHPHLIWRGPAEELSQPDFWADYDTARILGECTMLDSRNAALGMQQRAPAVISPDPPVLTSSPAPAPPSAVSSPTVRSEGASTPVSISTPSRPRVSLQDMIATSVALKSGLDVEIVHPSASWSTEVFPPVRSRSPSREVVEGEQAETTPESSSIVGGQEVPRHVRQALAGLQREVLLLRNELNLELWSSRENVKHIGRLYQDRVFSKTGEVERQGLRNKLREYKAEVERLQRELKQHKEQSNTVKNQLLDYNKKTQEKLKDFRIEKVNWEKEAAAMRGADKEAKETFAAQGKLLQEALQRVFQLETKIKENAPKVERLHDYEKQIAQLITLQRLWELDIQKLNDQTEYLQIANSKYRKMQLRLDTYERTHADLTQILEKQRIRERSLEGHLAATQKQLEGARKTSSLARMSTAGEEIQRLATMKERLRTENDDLRDEVEELKAMVETLKAKVSGRQGLVSSGRTSRSGSGTLGPTGDASALAT
ncbi:Hamartin protein-domain-containing protein [Rhodofomes roseus]|uniref:Hamartin protein-domain-containing protein n=1 Tax=Rhodofomes roseus TaxID=34475 RepID=A0ABQ8KUV5_9APHY|nr:Hamartin protein-domain-containing protein [Rhodofomes roseus]KAH9842596.1 Hamartin protein-domain-containing protein [Rhodofomes roseus]